MTTGSPARLSCPSGCHSHIAVAGLVPVGVLWTGGHYSEVAEIPLIARPVTEVSPRKPKYRSRAFLPVRPFRISRQSPHTLVFAPMQVNSGAGRSRLWDGARFKVFYSNGAHATAIHDSPALEDPVLTPVAGGVDVSVDVRHYAAADESVQVLAGYLDGSELQVLPLDGAVSSWGDGNGWVRRVSGHIPVHAAALRVFFQAAGANGRVSSLTNGGRFFAVDTPGTPRETHLALVAQATAGYRDVITVEADLSLAANGDPVNDVEVLFRLGAPGSGRPPKPVSRPRSSPSQRGRGTRPIWSSRRSQVRRARPPPRRRCPSP